VSQCVYLGNEGPHSRKLQLRQQPLLNGFIAERILPVTCKVSTQQIYPAWHSHNQLHNLLTTGPANAERPAQCSEVTLGM